MRMAGTLADIISLSSGFRTAVNLRDDLDNLTKAAGFLPTRRGTEILFDAGDNVHPTAGQRSRLITGTYGTGKSHLALVLANLYRGHDGQGALAPVFEKVRSKWRGEAERLHEQLSYVKRPFLLVLLEGDMGSLNDALLRALNTALIEQEDLRDMMPRTVFTAAARRVADLKENHPEAYRILEQEVERRELVSAAALVAQLEKLRRDAYEEFCEIHKVACAGAEFVPHQMMTPSEVYSEVAKEVRRSGKYEGIVIFWDEFGRYMERMVDDPRSDESEAVQRFADTCNNSGQAQIHLYLICHRSLQEYVELSRMRRGLADTRARQEDWIKVSRRFTEMEMRTSDEETFELIDLVVVQDTGADGWKRLVESYRDDLDERTQRAWDLRLFPEFDRQKVHNTVTLGSFPLHPMTAYCLPRLSQLVAQNEATLFTFLSDTGSHTLGEFVRKAVLPTEADAPLPTVPVDMLWEYFNEQIEDDPRTRQVHRRFRQADAKVAADDTLSKRVVRVIGVLEVIESDRVSATEDVLAYALAIDARERARLSEALARLSASDVQAMVRRRADNSYRFYRGVGEDMAEKLASVVRERGPHVNPIKHLNEDVRAALKLDTHIPATNYSDQHFIERQLSIEMIAPTALSNLRPWLSNLGQGDFVDGYALIVLADDSGEIKEAEAAAEQLAQHKQLVIAIPREPVRVEELLREHEGLSYLRKTQQAIYGEGGEQADEWEAWFKDRSEALRDVLGNLLNPDARALEWYWKGEHRADVRSRGTLRQLASDVMEEVFPLTPTVRHDIMTKREGQDRHRQHREPVIDMLFARDGPMLLKQEPDAAQQHVIRAALEETGILRTVDREPEIGRPSDETSPAMAAVWDEIDRFIETAKDSAQPMSELVRRLRCPPFGLPLRCLGVMIGAVARPYVIRGNLVLEHERTKTKCEKILQPRGRDIEQAVADADRYKLGYIVVPEPVQALLRGVAEAFDIALPEEEDISAMVVTESEGLRRWWMDQANHVGITSGLSEGAKAFRERILAPLIHPDADAQEILLERLPDIVETEDRALIDADAVAEKFGEIKQEIETAVARLRGTVSKTIVEVLGEDRDRDVGAQQALQNWFSRLSDVQRNNVFGGDAKLLKAVASSPGEDAVDKLATDLAGMAIPEWGDEAVERFRGHLESAKRSIEDYAGDDVEGTKVAVPLPKGSQVKLVILEPDGSCYERTFTRVDEISESGRGMENIVRSALSIGRTLKDGECETIMVRLLREMLDGC